MLRGLPVAAALAGLAAAPAALAIETADFDLATARDLVALCGAEESEPMYAEARQACYGYLAGAAHFHRALVSGGGFRPIACPDRELSREELAGLFVDWAGDHPEHMDEPPVEGVARAVVAVFPCDDARTGSAG